MAQKRQPRFTDQKSTVADAVADAISELQSLAEEMRSWHDNLPESLQGSEKGERIDECASCLENFNEPDVPEGKLGDLEVTYRTDRKASSRAARRDEACSQLSACIDTLNDQENNEDAEQLAGELQEVIDEVEGADFPGMYG